MKAMMTAAVSKYRSSIPASAQTEYRYAASVPSAIRVSMFAESRRARIAAPLRNGHPA
jgi:hypothetical protein